MPVLAASTISYPVGKAVNSAIFDQQHKPTDVVSFSPALQGLFCPVSSIGQSIGFLIRVLQIRILYGVPIHLPLHSPHSLGLLFGCYAMKEPQDNQFLWEDDKAIEAKKLLAPSVVVFSILILTLLI